MIFKRWLSRLSRLSRCRINPLVVVVILVGITILGVIQFLDYADSSRWDETNRQLITFAGQLLGWVGLHEKIPGPDLSDAVRAMQQYDFIAEKLSRSCTLVLEGRDAWGRPLIYEIRSDGRSVVIRSTGANGKDDGGLDDDLQQEVSILSGD